MGIYKHTLGKGEDVVILHGWGCNHQHMQPVAEHLSKKYLVSNFDLPGRGKSVWNPNIETIHDIADQLLPHLPANAIYVAWSFGGLIAMSIAARFPERVKKIVGITTTPKFIEDNNWPGFPKPGFIAAFDEIGKVGFKPFMTQYYDNEFSYCTQKPKAYDDLLEILNNDATDIDIILKGININSIPDIKALNSQVKINIIPDAQHMLFWTHQKEFNKVLDAVI